MMQTGSSTKYVEINNKQYRHDINKKLKLPNNNEITNLEKMKQHNKHLQCRDSKISCMQYHSDKKTNSLKNISFNEIDMSNFPRCALSSTKCDNTDIKTNENSGVTNNANNNNTRKVGSLNNKIKFHRDMLRSSDPASLSSSSDHIRRQLMSSQASSRSLREERRGSGCGVGNTINGRNNNDTDRRKCCNHNKSRRYMRRWASESMINAESEHSQIQKKTKTNTVKKRNAEENEEHRKKNNGMRRFSEPFSKETVDRFQLTPQKSSSSLRDSEQDISTSGSINPINEKKSSNDDDQRYISRSDSESELTTDSEHSKIQNESTSKEQHSEDSTIHSESTSKEQHSEHSNEFTSKEQHRTTPMCPVLPPAKVFLQLQITPMRPSRKGRLSSASDHHPTPYPSSCPTGRKDLQEYPRHIIVEKFRIPPLLIDEKLNNKRRVILKLTRKTESCGALGEK